MQTYNQKCRFCGRYNHLSEDCYYKNINLRNITTDRDGRLKNLYIQDEHKRNVTATKDRRSKTPERITIHKRGKSPEKIIPSKIANNFSSLQA